ncbi:MAG: PilZ domain-containing protein [Candidatus Tectimicrobiota bacterium]
MEEAATSPQCPRCGSHFVRRIRPQSPGEHLLRLAHVHPFQCQVCASRFTKYQAEDQRTLPAPDRRIYERIATAMRVTITDNVRSAEGVASDLSLDGCSLRTTLQIAVGERLRLSLHPDGEAEPIIVDRAIVRSVQPPLAGVQFLQFGTRGRERLSRIVRKLLTQQQTSA